MNVIQLAFELGLSKAAAHLGKHVQNSRRFASTRTQTPTPLECVILSSRESLGAWFSALFECHG